MPHQLLPCWIAIWSVIVTLTVYGWETASIPRCLQERSVNLYAMSYDNCVHYDSYDIEASRYPGVDIPLTAEDLICMNTYDELRSCASCYLCHHYLHHGQDIAAYNFALRSLQVSPASTPALDCLSAIYLKQGALVRASFYSSLAVQFNDSITIQHNFLEDDETIHRHLKTKHDNILHPDYTDVLSFLFNADEKDSHIIDHYLMFLSILGDLNGSMTLLHSYTRNLHRLPKSMIGPSVVAHEEFLTQFETLLGCHAEASARDIGQPVMDMSVAGVAISSLDLVPDLLPAIDWPLDKTVVLLVHPKFRGHTMTFDENVHGMCDALVRLGVPYRTVTRLLPENDFLSLQNFGVDVNEIMDKNYVYWNFEKNPRLAKGNELPGMLFDECGTI